MLDADPIIVDTVTRICADHCQPEVVNAAEDGDWPVALWNALEQTGMSLAWVGEDIGGPGATLADGFSIARIAARSALPVPIAETLLAGWLTEQAGLRAPPGPMSVAPTRPGATIRCDAAGVLSGRAHAVPFAAVARHLVVIADSDAGAVAALVRTEDCAPGTGTNLAGETQGSIELDGVESVNHAPVALTDPMDASLRMGAVLRAQQMAGALERVLEISLTYAGERAQFGRPIARFQAVQHNLARLAGEVAAAGAAADAASSAVIRHGIEHPRTLLAVAAAKIRAGEAAGAGAAIGHQVHGAMGFTREYALHHSTRRLWAWRDDFGAETVWATRLGQTVIDEGAGGLWPSLTAI